MNKKINLQLDLYILKRKLINLKQKNVEFDLPLRGSVSTKTDSNLSRTIGSH